MNIINHKVGLVKTLTSAVALFLFCVSLVNAHLVTDAPEGAWNAFPKDRLSGSSTWCSTSTNNFGGINDHIPIEDIPGVSINADGFEIDSMEGLVLWNKLGNQDEVENSEIGPGGTIIGGGFTNGMFGDAYLAEYNEEGLVTFPVTAIPTAHGCMVVLSYGQN